MLKLWSRYFGPVFATVAGVSLLANGSAYISQSELPPLQNLLPAVIKALVISFLVALLLALLAVWATGVIRRGKATRGIQDD